MTERPYRLFPTTIALWLFVVYLAIVLPLDRVVPPAYAWRLGPVLLLLSLLAIRALVIRMDRAAPERLATGTLLVVATLVTLLAGDVITTVYFNVAKRVEIINVGDDRTIDENLWDGELMPMKYALGDGRFELYKPRQRLSGFSYGEHYYPGLLKFPSIRDSVLRKAAVDYAIDTFGLRNTTPPEASSVFTLGDSFSFGSHMGQSAIFQALLHPRLGQPVYNMGVPGSWPGQQVELLEYFLTRFPDRFKIQHLLWMIFEGNDLEDDTTGVRSNQDQRSRIGRALAGTLIDDVFQIPRVLRGQSMLRRATDGRLTLRTPTPPSSGPNAIDGVQLVYPLYRSVRFGNRLFRGAYVERATKPRSYLVDHPNRPRLERAFERMRDLARNHGFTVTVVMVPTAVRLYQSDFKDLPPVQAPFFIEFLREVAHRMGFSHLDLNSLLAPHAAKELLYQRDDSHWNERGHQVVAGILANYLQP